MVIVDDAEKMNQEAQSCFLKTLEEPKGETLLILISSKPDMILPTIISRCQTIKFFRPKDLPLNSERLKREQEIISNLMPVMNANLSDKFKYVKDLDLEKQNMNDILEVMQIYFRNLLLAEAGIGKQNPQTVKRYPIKKIKDIVNLIDNINNKLLFTNANPKLALEILLMEL
jgi:DNA polymerase-3 subunit delta'